MIMLCLSWWQKMILVISSTQFAFIFSWKHGHNSKEYDKLKIIPDIPPMLATCNSTSSFLPSLRGPPFKRLCGGGCQCPTAPAQRPWPVDCVFPPGNVYKVGPSFGWAKSLHMVLDSLPFEIWKERYRWRHPFESLSFFGIKPGMVVVEADPGSLWYSRILQQYLQSSGRLIGMDYPPPFGMGGGWGYRNFAKGFPHRVHHHFGTDGAQLSAFQSGSLPESMRGTADVVLLIRILHDFPYFSAAFGVPWAPVLQQFLSDCYDVLKPGGSLGVIDHEASHKPDNWIYNGYLPRSFVIGQMSRAGFRLKSSSTINENPRDTPGFNDTVWRLTPTLNRGMIPEILAIGESNRMTLLFSRIK